MQQEYVLLRVPGIKRHEVLAARGARAPLPAREMKVETHSLKTTDALALRKEPETMALAPVMPICLIEPVELSAEEVAAQERDSGDVAWGVHATKAATSRFSGKGVTVAVLDSGIQAGHEAFRNVAIEQHDFTGEGDGDENGHGTHCAGTIFGGPVGGVRIGIAPGISKAMIGKVLNHKGRGSTRQMLDAVLWAVRGGANIISMSLGIDFPRAVKKKIDGGMDPRPATSLTLKEYRDNIRLFDSLAALVAAHSEMFSKAIVIAAAGNESKRPTYEIATAPPAAADGFLSVGALQKRTAGGYGVAAFSNAGPDLAGPGVDIRSAAIAGGLQPKNGTSMATPHVAGVAALWLEKIIEKNPAYKIAELEARLVGNADPDVVDAGERANCGAGLVIAPQT